ncbi:helix-turn-helix domain-containing protein [Delftia lacustris]|uniref:helix-turn-helix domain-containing protein n=1 Tax=Delftia lacustris TaxID=558537 RepID=UPI00193BB83A|nr:helix-turn-helix domain-containing protein [Delftia lacustris]QRI92503.1 helix-turn-helix domain-containing protein [Delftia lacustris]
MSSDYTTLAWRTELQSGPRLVFLALCDNANDAGNCFPSIQTLADKCGLSVRAVRGHVAAMEEQGLVQRIQRTGWSSEYQINLKVLRAAVYECLSKRPRLTEYDQMIMRSCAPETPADSAPRQDLPPLKPRQILPGTPARSATPPARSAGDPGKSCRHNLQRTYKE